MRDDA